MTHNPEDQPDTHTDTATALIVNPQTTGSITRIHADLDTLRHHLNNGWLEGISPNAGNIPWHAYIDEEGKIKQLPVNAFATILARTIGWHSHDVLCGPVIFLGNHPEGEEADVPAAVLEAAEYLRRGGNPADLMRRNMHPDEYTPGDNSQEDTDTPCITCGGYPEDHRYTNHTYTPGPGNE